LIVFATMAATTQNQDPLVLILDLYPDLAHPDRFPELLAEIIAHNGEPVQLDPPRSPTEKFPGTAGKVKILCQRAKQKRPRVSLWHPHDAGMAMQQAAYAKMGAMMHRIRGNGKLPTIDRETVPFGFIPPEDDDAAVD
jgi:hypothetical protein